MIKVRQLEKTDIEILAETSGRDHFEFSEYRFVSEHDLSKYFKAFHLASFENPKDIILVATDNNIPIGFLRITLNDFDSEIFNFPCFQFSFNIYSSIPDIIESSVNQLIVEADSFCLGSNSDYHAHISLRGNLENSTQIFNFLKDNGFYFIGTLLTFSKLSSQKFAPTSDNSSIKIRLATENDVEAIAKLAEDSFHFSRFHMDPFLSNHKADLLLMKSAANSVIDKYADIVYVAEDEGEIAGYYSGKKKYIKELNMTFGTAIISAVSRHYRGKGIFNRLDDNLLNWFSNHCDIAEMGTYLQNYPIHHTWIKKQLNLIRGNYQFSKLVHLK